MFDVAQFDGILKKMSEFNNALLPDKVGVSHIFLTYSGAISAFIFIMVDILCFLGNIYSLRP